MNNSGFILLDKPSGISSRAAGGKVARLFSAKTFGHVGTLDPMASGLLLIALGEATKVIPYLEGMKDEGRGMKEYEFEIEWGIKTDTDDITGKVINKTDSSLIPHPSSLREACASLIGEIEQTPPAYSAIHVNGKRAYELARRGAEFEIPKRMVKIYSLELIPETKFPFAGETNLPAGRGGLANFEMKEEKKFRQTITSLAKPPRPRKPAPATPPMEGNLDRVVFKVQCSTGTYVRSLVQQIAKKIEELHPSSSIHHPLLATCSMIRRTRTNGLDIKNSVALDFLENLFNNKGRDAISDYLHPVDFGLGDIPVWNLIDNDDARLFQNGGFISTVNRTLEIENELVRVYSNNGFIGIGRVEKGALKPKRIINVD